MKFKIGDSRRISKQFTSEDVNLFAILSEDRNPIHIDLDYASKSIFKKPIVHGFLYSSLISALIANEIPGPGSVYLAQELHFIKPVYHNQIITAEVKVIEIRMDKSIFTLSTICYNEQNEIVVDGKAVIKLI
jgi:acyl dehydratase